MIKNFGIKYKAAGENIAGNSSNKGAVNAVIDGCDPVCGRNRDRRFQCDSSVLYADSRSSRCSPAILQATRLKRLYDGSAVPSLLVRDMFYIRLAFSSGRRSAA